MSPDDNDAARRAFGDPDAPDGRPRIPRALIVMAAGLVTVAVLAAGVLVGLSGGSEEADVKAVTPQSAPDCVALWNEENAARHQIAAAFRRLGDAGAHVSSAGGRCRITISSTLAGRALRFTQDDTGVFGAFGPPTVLEDLPKGEPNARLREDGTLR
jgi:hypothetical protein